MFQIVGMNVEPSGLRYKITDISVLDTNDGVIETHDFDWYMDYAFDVEIAGFDHGFCSIPDCVCSTENMIKYRFMRGLPIRVTGEKLNLIYCSGNVGKVNLGDFCSVISRCSIYCESAQVEFVIDDRIKEIEDYAFFFARAKEAGAGHFSFKFFSEDDLKVDLRHCHNDDVINKVIIQCALFGLTVNHVSTDFYTMHLPQFYVYNIMASSLYDTSYMQLTEDEDEFVLSCIGDLLYDYIPAELLGYPPVEDAIDVISKFSHNFELSIRNYISCLELFDTVTGFLIRMVYNTEYDGFLQPSMYFGRVLNYLQAGGNDVRIKTKLKNLLDNFCRRYSSNDI